MVAFPKDVIIFQANTEPKPNRVSVVNKLHVYWRKQYKLVNSDIKINALHKWKNVRKKSFEKVSFQRNLE